ncbi:MAG TPA: 4Fe-4S binding protein, partial [Spirochaetales bacterium]|nr:4Fe-4S binding protein [Spirochaetales bacterium]
IGDDDEEVALLRPARQSAPAKDAFKDVRGTFTPEQIKKEAERCLSCGATFVDTTLCVGCGMCATKCKFDAISLERTFDGHGEDYRDLKPILIKSVLKRKLRIAIRKPGRLLKSAFAPKQD